MDVVLHHTNFGMGPSARWANARDRSARQAEALCRLQQDYGKPVVVAIRPPTTTEDFEQSNELEEALSRNGVAVFPSIARTGHALARLLACQRMHEA